MRDDSDEELLAAIVEGESRHHERCEQTKRHRVERPYCLKSFTQKDDRDHHAKREHPDLPKPACFKCQKCHETFNFEEVLERHLDFCGKKKDQQFKCTWPSCHIVFTRKEALQDHVKRDHEQQGGSSEKWTIKKTKTIEPNEERVALNGTNVLSTFYLQSQEEENDLKIFLRNSQARLKQRLEDALQEKRSVKWNLLVQVRLQIESSGTEEELRRVVTPTCRAGQYTTTSPKELDTESTGTLLNA